MNKVCTYLIVGNLFVLGAVSTYGNDVDVVQTILEKCGMSETPIADVAVVENGQVVSLNLNNKDISQDGIAELPPDIGKLAALRELSCTENSIESLPAEIGNCTSLQKINVGSNRIVGIPPEIGNLKKLTHLDVRHNAITKIPPEIKGCTSLTHLWLWGNKLTELDPAVTQLKKLKELYLKDNRLTTLPAGITKMKFDYVDFLGNKLCKLPPKLDAWAKKIDKKYKSTQRCQ